MTIDTHWASALAQALAAQAIHGALLGDRPSGTDVMVDIETLGKKPGCAITAIGAVMFDRKTGTGNQFYIEVDVGSCINSGLAVDDSTVAWHRTQGAEAVAALDRALSGEAPSLKKALAAFNAWLVVSAAPSKYNPLRFWGNGAAFDAPILRAAYDAIGNEPVWKFYNERCYRTLKNQVHLPEPAFQGTKHNALADALHQANGAVARLAFLDTILSEPGTY